MNEAIAGTALTGAEGSPPSAPSPTTTPPAEPTPQYLTRDEALSLLAQQRAEIERAAVEHGQRGAQSFIDKGRFNERITTLQKTLGTLVQGGHLDEATAAASLQEARWEALTGLMPDQQPVQAGGGSPSVEPLVARALQRLQTSGLQSGDPEYRAVQDPTAFADPLAWRDALDQALATKAARLARAQARENAQPASPTQPPTHLEPTGAAAVDVGGGAGTAVASGEALRKQLRQAYRDGDTATIARINDEIDRITKAAAHAP